MIWLAYFAIPVVLVYFARRRRDLPFRWMFLMFGAFIIGCGTTHLMEIVTTYAPLYRLAGLIKALTAAVSLVTAVALVPLVPRALLLRTPRELGREIEERKRAEQRLKASEEKFRLLVTGVEDHALLLLDPGGRVASWNVGAERALGYAAEQIVGRHFSCFFLAEDVQAGKPDREIRVAQTEGHIEDEGWRVRQDGSRFWGNIVLTALKDAAGNLKGYSKFIRDLTERKQAEEALRRAHDELEKRVRERTADLAAANQALQAEVEERKRAAEALRRSQEELETRVRERTAELQRSNNELEQFASIASHDLQEPLRKIQTFGDRLQTRCHEALGEPGREYVERMQASAARMQTLINDLLTFSRVTTKTRPFADVDLAAAVRHAVSDLEGRIQQTGGRVEIGALPTVRADATQIRQLFQNLIGNALKFHRPGAPPVVQVEGRVLAEPGAGAEGAGPGALFSEITVRDNGIGFEDEYRERIFQLFQRLHGHQEYEGTGLGLAICKKIVERHGGAITARGAPGEGATFSVKLPVRRPQPEEAM